MAGSHPVIRALTEEVATGQVMSAADRARLIDETAHVARTVAREAPERLGRLREDIELVSLEALIERFETDLHGPHARKEDHWQDFYNTDKFALQMVFSTPIVVALEHAEVQSSDIHGRGSRITDFLCTNAVTRTVLIVEIKTPATPLMAARPYRGKGTAEVFPPHAELSGAVAQAQSQMTAVSQDLALRLPRTPELDIDAVNDLRGAVIAGQASALSGEQRESFLRYRAGLSTVTVLGYDEVLERLKALQEMLTTPPTDTDPIVSA